MNNQVFLVLSPDRLKLFEHFSELSQEELHLRFGTSSMNYVENYINSLKASDLIFVVYGVDGSYVGVSHLATCTDDTYEIALSVVPDYQGKGIGTKLFSESISHVRVKGATKIFVNCLSHNRAIQHIAKSNGFAVYTQAGWSEGSIDLKASDSSFEDLFAFISKNDLAVIDLGLRNSFKMLSGMMTSMMDSFNQTIRRGDG